MGTIDGNIKALIIPRASSDFTDFSAIIANGLGTGCEDDKIQFGEIHVVRTTQRLFLETHCVSPTHHGDVADAAERLGLVSTPRACHPGDTCTQTDTNTFYLCIGDHGQQEVDWLAINDLYRISGLQAGDIIQYDGTKFVRVPRQASIANVSGTLPAISNPPTQSEVDALRSMTLDLQSQLNGLLTALRATGGNGLIAD